MEQKTDLSVIFTFSASEVENPYFNLLYNALRKKGIRVIEGDRPILFPLTRNVITNKDSDILHLDWIYGFYMTDGLTDLKPIDDLLTCVRAVFFLLDMLIISLLPTAVVWTVHNKHHHERKYPRVERVVNELAFLVVDGISVKCENARRVLKNEYLTAKSEKMYVAPDGNYISAYQNEVSTNDARTELGIGDDKFVFLFFGLIREYKGVPELISAFQDVVKPDMELWIVGNPTSNEYQSELEMSLQSTPNTYTRFGFIESENVQHYMNAADVLVLPYRSILNSGSVHLGLSFGMPIITPQIGCIPEVVPPENTFLYDPDGSNALRNALINSYNCSNLEKISEANYQQSLEQNWSKTAGETVKMYKSVTS
jgi:glycosyltransferase involved in cell wall biosynthesis